MVGVMEERLGGFLSYGLKPLCQITHDNLEARQAYVFEVESKLAVDMDA